MEKHGELHHSTVHGVFIGPARSGKNSLMERLLGKMPSSKSPSTGVAEAVVQVQVQKSYTMAANVEGSKWSRIDYDDEAIRLLVLHSDRENIQFEAKNMVISVQPHKSITSVTSIEDNLPTGSSLDPHKIHVNYKSDQSIAVPTDTHVHNKQHLPVSYVSPLEILKTAIESKGLQALQQHFKKTWSLYLSNTGGQMEFQEVLPLLVSGPCMFFYTFRLDRDLNECYEIHYELPDGIKSNSYKSSITTIEGIVQSLASIAAMGIFVYHGSQKRKIQLRPKVLFIGTHRDRLNGDLAADIISRIDQNLQKSTAQFSSIIEFASECQMMFAVNNFSQDEITFQEIRSAVEQIVERQEFEMVSPSRWLIYSLALRRLKDEVMSYEECFEAAKQCGITDREELNEALHFIHTKMGLIRYFPFEHIKNLVIIQPQFLYDKISELIVKTFTFEKAGKNPADQFKQKGVFSLHDFERIHRKNASTGAMKPSQFAELLKALRIAAPFEEGSGGGGGENKIFFSCVLGHASEAQKQTQISSLEISPLIVTFKCRYCPKGLGGALINYLMTNEMNSTFQWKLLTDQIFRDQVSFEVGPLDTVLLRILSTHLVLIYIPGPELDFPDRSTISCCVEDVCCDIRQAVDTGIRNIVQALNFIPSEVKPSFTFLCSCDECENKHPAETKFHRGKPICLCCTKTRKKHKLPQGYDKWFVTKPQIQFITTKRVEDLDKRVRLSELHHPVLLEKLTKYASHWRTIGEGLRFTLEELNNIEARPLLLQRAPASWLSAMLAEWLQWAPGDSRESKDFATIEALKFALQEAGLAAAASGLQL